ncbi:hypothetical protein GCM10010981_46490 [Dyella nitratireducens]|uniref:Uncharacterized protein n=1 Tax=Dyella nitratireducens TaxID=1849580 RepID=A0ABQ1GWN8_9GAMM|nr:hypothetical protein GCM10010981_46490 [Dyella nitratireducens]GLQ41659.1 hypothetical protein GCM10007902_15090 [Dyella nitratireducens]
MCITVWGVNGGVRMGLRVWSNDALHADDVLVGWGANPNIAVLIKMAMLGFTPQPTKADGKA